MGGDRAIMALPSAEDLLGPDAPFGESEGPEVSHAGPVHVKRRRLNDKDDRRQQQRQRAFPHVEGNYPTHVYVDVEDEEVRGRLFSLSHELADLLKAQQVLPLVEEKGCREGWHVSLSRPLVLRAGQIDTFTALLRKQIRSFKPFVLGFAEDLVVLRNDDRTTCFVCVLVDQGLCQPGCGRGGGESLDVLVDWVDLCLRRHGLQEYYKREERAHHVSLAWAPGEAFCALNKAIAIVKQQLRRDLRDLKQNCRIGQALEDENRRESHQVPGAPTWFSIRLG